MSAPREVEVKTSTLPMLKSSQVIDAQGLSYTRVGYDIASVHALLEEIEKRLEKATDLDDEEQFRAIMDLMKELREVRSK